MKKIFSALANGNNETQRLIKHFDEYIIACKTDLKGRIVYVSHALENVSGYSATELIGGPHTILNHPDMPKETFKNLWQTIQKGKTWNGDIKNMTKKGDFFWINTTIIPDIEADGKITGYNAISENITKAKAYEELSLNLEERVALEVKKSNENMTQMLQQSRLAQMGEMMSMIAHQWRQPLASISSIASTLSLDIMMNKYKEEYFQKRLEDINELSLHLSSTIDDFRNFFKEKKIKQKSTVKEVVNGCLTIIESSLKSHNIDLIIESDENIVIDTYVNELKQVLLNIIKNAEDALMEKKAGNPTVWINYYEKNEKVYITIKDNAGGVPGDIIEKIFDPYFSTKKKKEGTGLGLYMSKTIMKEHIGGDIMVVNEDGQGACFTLVLDKKEDK